jgi:hypothetical protein
VHPADGGRTGQKGTAPFLLDYHSFSAMVANITKEERTVSGVLLSS